MTTIVIAAATAPTPTTDCACSTGVYSVVIDYRGGAPVAQIACVGHGHHTSCGWSSPAMPLETAETFARAGRIARRALTMPALT